MKNVKSIRTRYEIFETTVQVNEKETVTSYGIICRNGSRTLQKIADISPNKTAIEALIKTINRSKLDPIQLEEVIEDSLDDLI